MPPTTSDRFFALAARVESALPDAGFTQEQAAELVGALRAYWEQPSEQTLEALKGIQERVLFAAARAGKVNREHPTLSAHYALDRAAQVFFANDPEPFTGKDAADYLDRCEQCLSHPPSTGARNFPCDPYPPPSWAKVEIAGQTVHAEVTFPAPSVFADVVLPHRPATGYARAFAEYNPPLTVMMDADEARRVAEHVFTHGQRTVFAAVALDGSGVWAIGDTEQEARAGAVDHRDYFRDCARSVDDDFPPPETDAAWLDSLALVTLSGTTESLRALIKSMETGDPVAPWCPADLWDSGEVTP